MNENTVGINAICDACHALTEGNIEKGESIIHDRYPHKKTMKARKNFTKKEQITIFMRDGFIDRYTGGKLICPGVLVILSYTLPDVFPYQNNWKTDECHQAWWNLFPSIDHIVPLAFGGTNEAENLVCTSMKRNLAKSTSSLEKIGWTVHPAGKLEDWDGMIQWFMDYVAKHAELLENNDIRRWYEACRDIGIECK